MGCCGPKEYVLDPARVSLLFLITAFEAHPRIEDIVGPNHLAASENWATTDWALRVRASSLRDRSAFRARVDHDIVDVITKPNARRVKSHTSTHPSTRSTTDPPESN